MQLTKNEFSVLAALACAEGSTQRALAAQSGLSLGSVNGALKSLDEKHCVAQGALTQRGVSALQPYKVDNAIILAAGLSSRFAPISYEKPKGLLKVKGEILIERQIAQLKEANVNDIVVVVGYKKEYFFYLEDTFGVRIVVNDEYASRNNNSSLMAAKHYLGNTYICSSDDYFTENPFQPYAWKAYYASQYEEGPTPEWCMKTGVGERIVSVEVGGCDSWIMLGHAYFDRAFSSAFVGILESEYNDLATADKLWEELYSDHIKELDMVLKPYAPGVIHEFDTLDELRLFDPQFLENIDSEVFDNIVAVLGCEKNQVHDVYPLKQGLTNLSCHFEVDGVEYVYRHPGVGTEYLIDRKAEVAAQSLAKDLGLDDTFIFEDPVKGWKISQFITGCEQLDPRDPVQVGRAMEMAHQLHAQPVSVERSFDFYLEGKRYERLLEERGVIDVSGYWEMSEKAERLRRHIVADNALVCLTHNDFFMLNFLVDAADKLYLIDWEYSGMSDYAHDFGTFVVCCELSEEEAERALVQYFGRTPTFEEHRHNFAYVALAGWCWYVWALFKEAQGEFVGEWLYIYYNYAKTYFDRALAWYEIEGEEKKVSA